MYYIECYNMPFHPQPKLASSSMANHNNQPTTNSNKDRIFSFPSTPTSQDPDSDFEFGSLTPDSPSGFTGDPYNTSPADHLFYNGRLLPHSFPLPQPQPPANSKVLTDRISRAASSRTSSVSSRDSSFMSSRSNSVNSRSSVSSRTSCSSSSTSSDISNGERKLLYCNYYSERGNNKVKPSFSTPMASKVVMAQLYGSSQRWQHITTPYLKREDSRRRSTDNNVGGILIKKQELKKSNNKKDGGNYKDKKFGVCKRFFMSFLVACRECHAMAPSREDDTILDINVKL